MDRNLLLKILGKKDSVDLGDMIFNLRKISQDLRDTINLNFNIEENFILKTKNSLNNIYVVIKHINQKLKNQDNLLSYTNSKNYLLKFTTSLCLSIIGLINSLEPLNIKSLIHHNNLLMDMLLMY